MTPARLTRELLKQRSLLRQLRSIFRSQGAVALRQIINGNPIDLSRWAGALADTAEAHLAPAAAATFRDILRRYLRRGGRIRQSFFSDPFAVEMPEVRQFIQRQAYNFARSVNQTSTRHATDAAQIFRNELAEGVERGEAQAMLTQRLNRIFENPQRTAMVTQTETMRAVHGGQLLAAERFNEPVNKTWLASSDACPKCLAIEGKTVPLGEPFIVDGTGPYAVIMHPPYHPNCMCSITLSVV